ncbi:hypothetical protein J6590_052024 [Homalodisca vitripennis]|nr:hypothetical protein J6590_052024 [Homalodisca vitripennis]
MNLRSEHESIGLLRSICASPGTCSRDILGRKQHGRNYEYFAPLPRLQRLGNAISPKLDFLEQISVNTFKKGVQQNFNHTLIKTPNVPLINKTSNRQPWSVKAETNKAQKHHTEIKEILSSVPHRWHRYLLCYVPYRTCQQPN